MGRKRPSGWNTFCIVVSAVWIAAVAFYAIWRHASDMERLRFWADSVEWSINADPMLDVSAKELRAKLGDEQFIAQAAAAYPRVDLRETLQRVEADQAKHPHRRYNGLKLFLWALAPPFALYLLGFATLSLGAATSWSRSSFR